MPRRWIIVLLVFCVVLNAAGFIWKLFEPVPLYDEIAHFVTPFVLVGMAAEIIYRTGETTSSSTRRGTRSSRGPPSDSSEELAGRESRSCCP